MLVLSPPRRTVLMLVIDRLGARVRFRGGESRRTGKSAVVRVRLRRFFGASPLQAMKLGFQWHEAIEEVLGKYRKSHLTALLEILVSSRCACR